LSHESDSVPCSRCGWPVSPRDAICIICGQRNPGAYSANPILTTIVRLRRTGRRLWTRLVYRWQPRLHHSPSAHTTVSWDMLVAPRSYITGIIAACVALYVIAIVLGTVWQPSLSHLLTPSNLALYKLGMTGRFPIANGRWWSLITAIYLHGSLLHIAFNMLAVYQIGPLVERLFGPARFFILYTLSGLCGALLSTLAGTPLTVGASGAIFGLMGALIYFGYRQNDLPRFLPILRWAAINFLLGMVTPQVDNWGHAGGFVGGALVAAAFMSHSSRRLSYLLYRRLATIALVATAIAIGISFLLPTGLTY